MLITYILSSLLSVASLTKYVTADLKITANHHSFGGVNFPGLQHLERPERDAAIKAIIKTGARVIRLFIQGDDKHPDPEVEIGTFAKPMLDQLDHTIAAIHFLSKGNIKVIISPHNAHALTGSNNVLCDAYCQKINGAYLDFYVLEEIRQIYKTRLQVLFREYPSANFGGRSWSELSEVILGVDLQNEPWSGVWPIVAGEPWLCDIATYLRTDLGLGQNNIAVITGGISGPQSLDGNENYPDSAFDCEAVDVIGIHGYYAREDNATAGTTWAQMFVPGNTLTARALAKKKLLFVEEMSYMHTKAGLAYKHAAIWDQGNALNYRGIPWLYSHVSTGAEGTSTAVSLLRDDNAAIGSLKDVMKRASTSRSNFKWTKYLPAPPAITNLTTLPLNPFVPEQSDCTFGCTGFLCDAADGCDPSLICKNSICIPPPEKQPGNIGAVCNTKQICQEHLTCTSGTCQACIARPSIPPADIRKRTILNSPNFQCELDASQPFRTRPICKNPLPFRDEKRLGNPCDNAQHCDANEFCDWGRCKVCTEGCLGMKCKGNNKCKTGYCNSYGRCDYADRKERKGWLGNPHTGKTRGGSKKKGSGPDKVYNVPMKVNIPKDKVEATGGPVPTQTQRTAPPSATE